MKACQGQTTVFKGLLIKSNIIHKVKANTPYIQTSTKAKTEAKC